MGERINKRQGWEEMERKPQEIGHKKQVKIGIEEFCEDGNEDSSSRSAY